MAGCYVYAIRDGESVLYVGKGSGHRLATQCRAFGFGGDILEECRNDTLAFQAERKWIAKLRPTLNRCSGGNGNRRKASNERKSAWERTFDLVGSKRYSARLLLACERSRPGSVDPSKIEQIRQVAHGCRA